MMAREYNNGIETEENMKKFREFLRIQGIANKTVYPDNFNNWLVWKNCVRKGK
jgi:hypothetical protein